MAKKDKRVVFNIDGPIGIDIYTLVADTRVPDDVVRFRLTQTPLYRYPGDVIALLQKKRPKLAGEILHIVPSQVD